MNILALDIATLSGFAVWSDGQRSSGVWQLKPPKGSCDRTRQLVLWRRLEETRKRYAIDTLAYEEVAAHGRSSEVKCKACGKPMRIQETNTQAAHVYGALSGHVDFWLDMCRLPPAHTVHVSTLKKFATGNGRATKEEMVTMAERRWPEQRVRDDNQADALHILDWVMVKLRIAPKAVIDLRQRPDVEF